MFWASPFSRIVWSTYTIKHIFVVETAGILDTGFIGTAVMSIFRYFATSFGLKSVTA